MNTWMLIWKIVFIVGVTLFGLMAVWVMIWGAVDIKKLLQSINKEHQTGSSSPDELQKKEI